MNFFRKFFSLKTNKDNKNVEYLKEFSCFKNLTVSELVFIENRIYSRFYDKDEMIYKENFPQIVCYLVKSGEVELFIEREDKKYIMAKLFSGHIFGEAALFSDNSRHTSAVCNIKTELLTLSRDDLKKIIDNNPKIGCKILFNIAKNIVLNFEKVGEINENL